MTTRISTPTKDEIAKRISRFDQLQPMSTAKDLDWVPQSAMDIIYARGQQTMSIDSVEFDNVPDTIFEVPEGLVKPAPPPGATDPAPRQPK